MWLSFMSEDVSYHIPASRIGKIEEIGDSLTITDIHGEGTEYQMVCATQWNDQPKLDYWEYCVQTDAERADQQQLFEATATVGVD